MNPSLSHPSKSDLKYTLIAIVVIAMSLFLLLAHRTPKKNPSGSKESPKVAIPAKE